MRDPITAGFHEAVLSVDDVRRTADPLVRVAGWTCEPLPDAPREQWAAWHVPAGCTRIEQALLRPDGDTRGFLRLVKFHGVETAVMRSSQHTWDTGGIFDVDVYVRDARALYRELQREGWSGFGEPTDYAWGGFEVCEALAAGPGGFVVGLLQAYGKVLIELPDYRAMSRPFNSAQIVRDYDASFDFYTRVLGWGVLVDTVVENAVEPGAEVLGIPLPLAERVRRRVGILHPRGTNDGSIELIEMRELQGRDCAERCVAPNVGYLALRFPVADAVACADAIRARGVTPYSEPRRLEIAPYGAFTVFGVRTPDGALLEFAGPAVD